MKKYQKCTNCKHSEVSHYKKTATNRLPDVLVGSCKIPFCECSGFEADTQVTGMIATDPRNKNSASNAPKTPHLTERNSHD